jgi:hypothetical protein
MARMIPDVDPATVEHSSEEPVYRALRDQLPDEYMILHSYPWLRPWRGEGALAEGEADFVVLHPEKGLLVLEVKGGSRSATMDSVGTGRNAAVWRSSRTLSYRPARTSTRCSTSRGSAPGGGSGRTR